MSLKGLLFAATMATSQFASGNDDIPASPIHHTQGATSHKIHDSLSGHGEHKNHLHVEVSAGIEHNHILDHGQVMEDDFISGGIHGSLGNWEAYYHWLQSQKSSLEHKAGVSYGIPLSDSLTWNTGITGVYEVSGSHEGASPEHVSAGGASHDGDDHSKPKEHGEDTHSTSLSSREATIYAGISTGITATLHANQDSKTLLRLGGEYDMGSLKTGFVTAGIEHIHSIGDVQVIMTGKVIDILTTNSSHLQEGLLGVGGLDVKIPLGASDKWFLNLGGQMTTRGDKAGKVFISRTF